MNDRFNQPLEAVIETSPRDSLPQFIAYGANSGATGYNLGSPSLPNTQGFRKGNGRQSPVQRNEQVYFPTTNDLRMGAQGYSSCSELQDSEEYSRSLISKSNQGADTYAGHLSSYYDTFGGANATGGQQNQQSQSDIRSAKKSLASKAYGMEHGNWMGMDASIQDQTLQDTTCANLASDVKTKDEVSFLGSKLVGQQRFNRGPLYQSQDRPQPQMQNVYSQFGKQGSQQTMHGQIGQRKQIAGKVNFGRFGDQSTILDDTLGMMDQTQNKTLYQEVQTKHVNLSRLDPALGYFQQVNSPRKSSASPSHDAKSYGAPSNPQRQKRYVLTLKIFYKTEFGESLQIVGSSEEFGQWKQYKCPMKWTEGHIWIAENIEITSCSYFNYKYVVMFQNKAIKWEKGPNRIADLDILPDLRKLQMHKNQRKSPSPESRVSGMQSHYSGMYSQKSTASIKHVELKDHWEHFSIRFSIFSPSIKEENGEVMRIIGSIPELTKSGTVGSGPLKMKRAKKKFRWLHDKYGQEMRPWETLLKLSINKIDGSNEIIYSYSNSGENQKDFIYEREPSRIMEFQDPASYRGELGAQRSSQWRNWDKVWIVNGHVEKADGNFLGELLFTKVGDTGICIGPHPCKEEDIQRLRQAGITGVLNLMTANDYRQRGYPWRKMEKFYQEQRIKSMRFPVNDLRDKELQSNLFFAAQHLNNMINNLGLNVYVHCTSGISRSPAAIIVYLCLFKRIKCWQEYEDVAHFVRAFNPKIHPNMRIIRKCLQANEDFQKGQGEQSNQQKLGETIEDSFYFPNMIVEESKHNPLLTVQDNQSDFQSVGQTIPIPHTPIKKFQSVSHSIGHQIIPKGEHRRELSPQKSLIPNQVQSVQQPKQVISASQSSKHGYSSPKQGAASAKPADSKRISPTINLSTRLADLQTEIEEFDPKNFMDRVETVDLLKIEYKEPSPQPQPQNPPLSNDIIQLQIDQEVANKVADLERRLKQEADAALERAVSARMAEVGALDRKLKEKEEQLKKQEDIKQREMVKIKETILKEQEERRVMEEDRLRREYERQIQMNKEIIENEKIEAMIREKRVNVERERMVEEKRQEQERLAEKLKVEMEEKLNQMMNGHLQRQIQLDEENKRIREQQDLKMLQLQREAEEAKQETIRIQSEISKRQEQEEHLRQQKAIQAQQDQLRAKQLELESITADLTLQHQKIDEQRKKEEIEQQRAQQEAREAVLQAELLRRELEMERQKQLENQEKIKEEMAFQAETIKRQEQQKAQEMKLLQEQQEEKLRREFDSQIRSMRELNTIPGKAQDLPTTFHDKNEVEKTKTQNQKTNSQKENFTFREPPTPNTDQNNIELQNKDLNQAQIETEIQAFKNINQKPENDFQQSEFNRQKTLQTLQMEAEEAIQQERLAQIRARKDAAEKERLERIKRQEQENLEMLVKKKKEADERKQEMSRQRELYQEATAQVSDEIIVRVIERTAKDVFLEEKRAQEEERMKEQAKQAEGKTGLQLSDQLLKDRKERLAQRKEAQRLKKKTLNSSSIPAHQKPLISDNTSPKDEPKDQDPEILQDKPTQSLEMEQMQRQKIEQTEQELLRLQTLRRVEEEKLRLIKIAREVEEQKKLAEERQLYSQSNLNRFYQSNSEAESSQKNNQANIDRTVEVDISDTMDFDLKRRQSETMAKQGYFKGFGNPAFSKSTSEIDLTQQSFQGKMGDGQIESEIEDLNELKFEQQRDEFFREAPIKFKIRRGNRLEELMGKIIKKLDITIPVIHVRSQMYLIGTARCNLELKLPSTILVKNAPNYMLPVKLEKYLQDTQAQHKKDLCSQMSQTKQNIERVCEMLSKGMKMQTLPQKSDQIKANKYGQLKLDEKAEQSKGLSSSQKLSFGLQNSNQTPKVEKSKYSQMLTKSSKTTLQKSRLNTRSGPDLTRNQAMGKGISQERVPVSLKPSLLQQSLPTIAERRRSDVKVFNRPENHNRGQGAPFVTPLRNINLDVSQCSRKGDDKPGQQRFTSPGSAQRANQRFVSSRLSNSSNRSPQRPQALKNSSPMRQATSNNPQISDHQKQKQNQTPQNQNQTKKPTKKIGIYSSKQPVPPQPELKKEVADESPIEAEKSDDEVLKLQQSYLDAQISDENCKNKYLENTISSLSIKPLEKDQTLQDEADLEKDISVAIDSPTQQKEKPSKNIWTSASAEKISPNHSVQPLAKANPMPHLMDTYSMQTVPEMSENQENYSFASASVKQTNGNGNFVKNQSIASFKKQLSDTDGMTFTDGDEEKNQYL